MKSGITPACAGKTRFQISLAVWLWDHPRVCGKNSFISSFADTGAGSPPRVREKLSWQGWFSVQVWDHPRVCGKNPNLEGTFINQLGSPPRVREKLSGQGCREFECRITPACAGKTRLAEELGVSLRDHPRVCGKNYLDLQHCRSVVGSPPRVREKPLSTAETVFQAGITPACAGKT